MTFFFDYDPSVSEMIQAKGLSYMISVKNYYRKTINDYWYIMLIGFIGAGIGTIFFGSASVIIFLFSVVVSMFLAFGYNGDMENMITCYQFTDSIIEVDSSDINRILSIPMAGTFHFCYGFPAFDNSYRYFEFTDNADKILFDMM